MLLSYIISEEVISMLKKYPFIKQTGIKDCAAASLLMIIKYYKGYINIEQLSDMLETNRNGTTAYNIIKVANEIGFSAKGIKTNLNELNSSNLILPVIAHVVIDNKYKHYIVIYEINYKNKTIIIGDPQDKIKKISFEEFEKIWTNILIVLYPKTPIPRNNTNSHFEYIYNLLKKYKNELLQMILISLLSMFFAIITSFYFESIIENINSSQSNLILIFIIFSICYLIRIVSDFFRNKLLIYFNQKLELDINFDAFKKVLTLPYHYYRNRTTGEVITKINNLDSVRDMISKVFLSVFVDLPLSFISLIILYFISNRQFIVAIIMLILYVITHITFSKTLTMNMKETQENKANLNSYMFESISGFETIKGLNLINYIKRKYEKKYVKFLNSIFSLQTKYAYQLLFKDLINTFGQAVIIIYGCILIQKNELTLGTLITFNTILSYFLEPLKNIIDLDYLIKDAKISLKNVLNMLEINTSQGILNKKIKGTIKIKELSLELNNKNIINNLSLEIKEGTKLMIIGKSGSGKSTLLKILMKYYKINRNQIYINDVDYTDYKTPNGIKCISQGETLFTDTLYNNVILDNNDTNKFLEIAKICKLDEIIENENTGYNMLIEENGFNISGGQKQRFVLARALMQKFNILLIDEGLNQVDINLERKILKNMFKKFKDKTIIIISHRLENMDLFDQVVELNNGKITNNLIRNE